jgi:hypothetical protein
MRCGELDKKREKGKGKRDKGKGTRDKGHGDKSG